VHPSRRAVARGSIWRRLALLVLALAPGCAPPRDAGLPPGAWLAGDAAALRRVLGRLESRSDVPLGRTADRLRQRIDGCARVLAHAAQGGAGALLDAIRCAPGAHAPEPLSEPAALRALQGDADLVIALPLGERGRLSGPIRVDPDGGVALDARVELGEVSGPEALWLPGERPPGPAVLRDADTLVHARLRPAGGLPIADWVPRGSQGDQMFRLRSQLFAGAVLDGTWELAVYVPDPGMRLPPAALAVGFRLRSAAEAAVEQFVSELRTTWPVQRTALRIEQGDAACLSDLRVLPELAPCWLVGESALVVAWNEASLRRALGTGEEPGPLPNGGAVVRLDRFAQADAALQAAAGRAGAADFPPLDYAWQRLVLEPRRSGPTLELSLRLIAGGAS
jgi:hypothetical protein